MVISRWIAGAGLAFLLFGSAAADAPTFPASATGDWTGTVQAKDALRHVFLHVHQTRTGVIAILTSPEGPAGGMVARPLAADEGVLAFAADDGRFEGQWSAANGRWKGIWTEAGVSAPLSLSLNDDGGMRTSQRLQRANPGIETPPPRVRYSDPAEVVPPGPR